MINKGQYIKCIFHNGTLIEGIVEEWSNANVQIKSIHDDSVMIIMHPEQDLMLVKIMPNKKNNAINHQLPPQNKLDQQYQETKEQPSDDLRLAKLAELKTMMNEQEKQIIKQKLKSHQLGNIKPMQYQYPPTIFRKA